MQYLVTGDPLPTQCAVSRCSVLVCWLGRESLQKECLALVRDLWSLSISADILYESMEMATINDIQRFCKDLKIPHIVILGDRALYFERKQVRVLASNGTIVQLMGNAKIVHLPLWRGCSIISLLPSPLPLFLPPLALSAAYGVLGEVADLGEQQGGREVDDHQ